MKSEFSRSSGPFEDEVIGGSPARSGGLVGREIETDAPAANGIGAANREIIRVGGPVMTRMSSRRIKDVVGTVMTEQSSRQIKDVVGTVITAQSSRQIKEVIGTVMTAHSSRLVKDVVGIVR